MKHIPIFLLFCVISATGYAQNADCKVLTDSLQGSYEGDCKSGKADGTGKAVGVATYEGDFKKGYPDGTGKYTWANGDFYYGGWKKGLKEGKGELHKIVEGVPALMKGYWKKDNYHGEYENPYEVKEMGMAVTYKNFQYLGTRKNSVYFSMKTGIMGVANTSNYTVLSGLFQRTNTSEVGQTQTIEFQDVQFPFRVRFMGTDRGVIDVEFYDKGEWRIEIAY